jgi:hypothetical protein
MNETKQPIRLIHQVTSILSGIAVFAAVLVVGPATAKANNGAGPRDGVCEMLGSLGVAPSSCHQDDGLSAEIREQINALTRSVQPFYNYDVAGAAGWNTPISDCVESPMGGMGYHIANLGQLGSGHLNLLRPQVLLYAPTQDGSMAFQGVEYIIPADLWDSPEPPNFLGQDLRFNPNIPPNGIWALHVWVGTPNPNGIFEDFNPEVSCEFAAGE